MKTLTVILLAGCLVASTYAYPGIPRDSDESDEDFGLGFSPDDMGTGWPQFYYPYFDRFHKTVADMMTNLREQFTRLMSQTPEFSMVPFTSHKIPEGANTTSTTKIIDGHIVTINETTYTDGDDEHGTLIRVRIVDVKPLNETILMTESETEAEATTSPPTGLPEEDNTTAAKSVETVEEFDNEIPKGQVETLTA